MVVDYLHYFGFGYAVDGLRKLGVVNKNDVLLVVAQHVCRTNDAHVVAVVVNYREEAMLRACHDALRFLYGGVHREKLDFFLGNHLGADGNGHGDETRCGVRVVRGRNNGAAAFLGEVANNSRYVGATANHEAAGTRFEGETLRFVAVGDEHCIAGNDEAVHHFGRGANEELPALNDAVGIAYDDFCVEGVEDVAEAGASLGEHERIQNVHVGVRNVLNGNEPDEVVVLVGNAKRAVHGIAHEIPRHVKARLAANALQGGYLKVLDLRRDARNEPRLRKAKVAQRVGGFAIDGPGATSLVGGLNIGDLILKIRIANCGADAIGIGVEVSNNVNLADGVWLHVAALLSWYGILQCT